MLQHPKRIQENFNEKFKKTKIYFKNKMSKKEMKKIDLS